MVPFSDSGLRGIFRLFDIYYILSVTYVKFVKLPYMVSNETGGGTPEQIDS